MSFKDGQEAKYYYRYTFVQRKEMPEDEESKAQARAYVNGILGLARRKDEDGNVVSR